MPVLVAAVAVVGVLCVLDLLLTFGVIRRLREHTELITRISAPDVPVISLTTGESPSAFSAITMNGTPVTGPAGLRTVAFLSTTCSVCPGRVAPFMQYLIDHRIGKQDVLAVVVGLDDDRPSYTDQLAKVAQVSPARHNDELTKAFKVVGYPAFCLLGTDGAVLATTHDPALLPVPVAV
jgi:cytochrome oxidase Cu insertion factor (SCO1/SenC/PrrC family)